MKRRKSSSLNEYDDGGVCLVVAHDAICIDESRFHCGTTWAYFFIVALNKRVTVNPLKDGLKSDLLSKGISSPAGRLG
jgi:hypothetical protein